MKWKGRETSGNVEDRRGGRKGVAVGGVAIIIALLAYFVGGDPTQLMQVLQNQQTAQTEQTTAPTAEENEAAEFVSVVLKDTEDIWAKIFQEQLNSSYSEPKLVLFTSEVQSACGFASAASGPFYCPADRQVYIDLSFYDELKNRFGAPGDFAMAYVVAHEVGHHVQNLLGISDKLHKARGQVSEEEYNQLSVKLELQADFFAGLWAHYDDKLKGVIEAGDIDEALTAANAIGDDRLQMEARGYVVPESFTHGTSEQRMFWFKKGYTSGDVSQGDTFAELP